MKKILAGLALSAALVMGTAVATAPAEAAGIYVSVGGGHHHHWRHHNHWRGYYWHNRYWHNRYRCHHGWCYR
jgi:Spy/CpxP family protein refolding chaperone